MTAWQAPEQSAHSLSPKLLALYCLSFPVDCLIGVSQELLVSFVLLFG
jgi:hypothetical protein